MALGAWSPQPDAGHNSSTRLVAGIEPGGTDDGNQFHYLLARAGVWLRTAPKSAVISMQEHTSGRHALGLLFLMLTVFMWTASSFLASDIFADGEYSKPFFVTYVNASFFAISFGPAVLLAKLQPFSSLVMDRLRDLHQSLRPTYIQLRTPIHPSHASAHAVTDAHGALDTEDSGFAEQAGVDALDLEGIDPIPCSQMTFRETVRLSLEFSILWFVANYFAAACLQDTSVASSTILTSTSSIWTLLIGALIGVEMFSLKKLLGVFASLAGVILISSVDIGTNHDGSRGSFPHKSRHQIAVGDVMALVSALVYGIYTTVMKKRIGDESRVSMPIFFGLIGVFNTILLWPGLLLLHYTGQETFQFPPTQRIWTIILINSATSFLSDLCWAYAMLLTSPLVVTVGLSLTIPLSLVGQMIIEGYYVSTAYWVGAIIVFLTFVFINHESIVEPSSSTAIAVVNESTTQG